MSFEPLINWQFHKTPGLIDPRATFTRASTGRITNRNGNLITKPANAARFRFNPTTGVSEGYLSEPQRTNLALWSEVFDDVVWSKPNLTVTANTVVGPDGATTADTLTATGAEGRVVQTITITAGRGAVFSFYAKAATSNFLYLKFSDGTNTVLGWFNLANGTVGTNTAGSGTLLFSQKIIEAAGNGWYRCSLEVTTTTITSITIAAGPAASDNVLPANTDSIYAIGAQLEAETTLTNLTSYIPTTSATVTRSADSLYMPVTSAQVPLDRGTMVFEWVQRALPATMGGQAIVLGGIGNTFDNTIYVNRTGATSVGANYIAGGVTGGLITRTCLFAVGTTYRAGVAWQTGRMALCLDGGAVTSTTTNINALASVARIGVGMAPWGTSGNTVANAAMRALIYAPTCASDALLQQLTAP